MPDSLSSMTAARSELARLHVQADPDPDLVLLARAKLVCARLDNRIREYSADAGVRLRPVHVAHLVGLLLAESGVDGSTVGAVERAAHDAVATAQGGNA
ncbi:MAG: hypothetical protein JWO11_3930 [Nocardioides sp.]|nr:hypothetical protein [Nocardioides sp.]